MQYTKREAKDWAREHMRGVCNVIMPTFTSDLKQLNEKAIRYDVRRDIELGFWGALIVSECGTTHEEYKRFLDICADEARGRLHLVLHGSFDTLEDTIEMCRYAEGAGSDLLLLSYPPSFYPRSDKDIYDYTAAVLNATNLATVLFQVHQWNFGRINPADFSTPLVRDLAELPNAVAIKAEGGAPGNASIVEILDACGDRLLISDPREWNSPGWVKWFGMQWMGTSNFEYCGDAIPRYFALMHEGKWDEALEIYWRIQPARQARLADMATFAGANFIHRASWKYQGWLNGFNGGPLRLPVMKFTDHAVHRLRDAFIRSKIIPADTRGDVGEFFVGRNPA